MFLASLLLSLVVLEDPQARTVVEYTVVEPIEMTPEQEHAVSLVMTLGATVGRCADGLPLETRQLFDGGYQNVETTSPAPAAPIWRTWLFCRPMVALQRARLAG